MKEEKKRKALKNLIIELEKRSCEGWYGKIEIDFSEGTPKTATFAEKIKYL